MLLMFRCSCRSTFWARARLRQSSCHLLARADPARRCRRQRVDAAGEKFYCRSVAPTRLPETQSLPRAGARRLPTPR